MPNAKTQRIWKNQHIPITFVIPFERAKKKWRAQNTNENLSGTAARKAYTSGVNIANAYTTLTRIEKFVEVGVRMISLMRTRQNHKGRAVQLVFSFTRAFRALLRLRKIQISSRIVLSSAGNF